MQQEIYFLVVSSVFLHELLPRRSGDLLPLVSACPLVLVHPHPLSAQCYLPSPLYVAWRGTTVKRFRHLTRKHVRKISISSLDEIASQTDDTFVK